MIESEKLRVEPNLVDSPIKLITLSYKLECNCKKDESYSFACRKGVYWFVQTVLKNKIKW